MVAGKDDDADNDREYVAAVLIQGHTERVGKEMMKRFDELIGNCRQCKRVQSTKQMHIINDVQEASLLRLSKLFASSNASSPCRNSFPVAIQASCSIYIAAAFVLAGRRPIIEHHRFIEYAV